MNGTTRTCANCQTEFLIEPEDVTFYQRVNTPWPTWCPRCRNIRRFAWREERSLYKRSCDLCRKDIISTYAADSPFKIYCRPCWQSDRWDPMDYGREYDFKKPFFAQYRELMLAVPRPALTGDHLVNSEYSQSSVSCKNCYLIFGSYFSEDSQYSFGLLLSRNTFDAYFSDNSDHAYEALHCNRLYRTSFAYFSDECLDSAFLFNCVGCSDCFGCVNIRKQKYRLFNEQLSKEEYRKQRAYWDLGSYARLEEAKEKFRVLRQSLPHRYAHVLSSNNVTGDIIRGANNCKMCFVALDGVENCKFMFVGGLNLKDSYDSGGGGDLSELLYETIFVTRAQNTKWSAGSGYCSDVRYSDWIGACSDIFGSIGLKNKKYCVLNKQYSPEAYKALTEKIKTHMEEMPYIDKKGRAYGYGEFFPMEFATYAYNETLAFAWYPKTKEEVLAEGLAWRDPPERDYAITINAADLPDHIDNVDDAILQETISCRHGGTCNQQCSTAFRLTKQELDFYRIMRIALPRLCWNCRFAERLLLRNSFDLHHRRCMCAGQNSQTTDGKTQYANTANHFHGETPCSNEFETTYSADRPEMVYCDQCYQTEFL